MAFAVAESEWDLGASIGTVTKGMLFYRGALAPLNNAELFWDELLQGAANLTGHLSKLRKKIVEYPTH